jgi:PIN domain nuclease of toxin-antitoxin system
MSEVIIDASALLALLLDEPGAAKIADVIADARMSSANYAEVVRHLIRAGVRADQVEALVGPLPLTIVEVDEALATIAERLRATTDEAGLAMGALSCLALAKRDGLPVLTADKRWRTVADAVGVTVVVVTG